MSLTSLLHGPPSLTLGPEASLPTPFAFRSDGRFHSYSSLKIKQEDVLRSSSTQAWESLLLHDPQFLKPLMVVRLQSAYKVTLNYLPTSVVQLLCSFCLLCMQGSPHHRAFAQVAVFTLETLPFHSCPLSLHQHQIWASALFPHEDFQLVSVLHDTP